MLWLFAIVFIVLLVGTATWVDKRQKFKLEQQARLRPKPALQMGPDFARASPGLPVTSHYFAGFDHLLDDDDTSAN